MMNDLMDEHHERERRRLNLSSDEYWYRLAAEKVGSTEDQIADVLAQLRSGGYENRIRADTIEHRLKSILPDIPTPAMVRAYKVALRAHIRSIPLKDRPWDLRSQGKRKVYMIPDDEKAIIRYRAMVAAFQAEVKSEL